MKDMLEKIVHLGLGLWMVGKEQVEKVVDELVKRGEVAPAEAKKLVNDILERGREEKARLDEMVRDQIKKALSDLHLVSREEFSALKQRVQELEEKLQALAGQEDFPE